MRRRSRAGGEPAKAQRRKTVARKSRSAPKAGRPRSSAAAGDETKVARLTRERDEALAKQTATSEILRVISQSPTDVRPVFDSIVLTAARLLRCDLVLVLLCDGATYSHAAVASPEGPFADLGPTNFPIDPSANFPSRAIVDKKMLHLPDWSLINLPAHELKIRKRFGTNSALYLPLLREEECIGLLTLVGKRPNIFGPVEIAQAELFRDQALIAIENARLFEAEQQRTRELAESLKQQTATSEVLQVISRSAFDLDAVLNTLVESASRVCEAERGVIIRPTGEGASYHSAASYGHTPEYDKYIKTLTFTPGRDTVTGRVLLAGKSVQIADVLADAEWAHAHPGAARLGNFRTMLGAPLLREGTPIGIFLLQRAEVRPFTEKQIKLVETFADQAVIAIENTRLFEAEQQRTRELAESLEQQTATSEVLKIISSSPGELEPVFQAMLENAVRICEAKFGHLILFEGDLCRIAAAVNMPPALAKAFGQRGIFEPTPGSHLDRLRQTKQVSHTADDTAEVVQGFAAKYGGARSVIAVPMLSDDILVGAILIYRQEVRPFTDKQIALVQNFAAQAVIAIENTRLLNELRQRTDDLSEALEQQTATSDVLQVISSSPGDLQPVFAAMLGNATRICDARFGNVYLWDGDAFHLVATHNTPSAFAESRKRGPFRPGPTHPFSRLVVTKQILHVDDVAALPGYLERDPQIVEPVELGGIRTCLVIPMLKDANLIGALVVFRQEVRRFNDKQIALLTNLAAQAVIAIENTRLLSELRESLQQQTATSDVLRVISSSPGELEPVFEAMLESATRICEANFGGMFRLENGAVRMVTRLRVPERLSEFLQKHRDSLGPLHPWSRLIQSRRTLHIADYSNDRAYLESDPVAIAGVELGGIRTLLAVPMLKDDELVGFVTIFRQEVRPFTDKQIELVSNFANQAVIAIENTRLLTELRHRTDELAQRQAELNVTFDNMGDGVVMFNADMRLAAWNRNLQEILDVPDSFFAEPRTYRDYMTYLIERGEFGDVDLETELRRYIESADRQRRIERTRPDGRVLEVRVNPVPGGGFVAIYSDVTERKKADERVRAARDAAETALRELKSAQDRLVQTEKLASLGQLTAGIAHEIKNPLNFVNNFSGVSTELIDELREALGRMTGDDKTRHEIAELTDTLHDNLDKIVQHGKRADAIVKNMLLHSREGSGEHRPVNVNALVEESLNLAYHGARAEKQGFKINMERFFDPAASQVDVFPQEITRALLNLISNGFYAATKRKEQGNGDGYEPTLTASTKNLGDRVEIRICDNGIGIPPEVKEKMFNPFFTTKPAGEGTGLGLSISHDIIVKQHGGSIEVDTLPGEFTEVRVILPRTAALITDSQGRA